MLAPKMMFASSCACSWIERRRLLDLPHLQVRAADDVDEDAGRAVDRDVVEQRRLNGLLRGEARAALALGAAGAHERAAHAGHDRLHVGEVDVDDAVLRDEVADALHGLEEDLVGLAERVDEREIVVAEQQELLVRDRDERVDVLAERGEARFGAARALATFEEERLGHDADGEGALFARELRDDGRCAGAGAAAHAGGDEHHVGARHDAP